MAEFDFAPRPPKQTDQAGDPSPFASPAQSKPGDENQRSARPGAAGKNATRNTARGNPGESSGMLAGLVSMATTMGMARHTNAHVEPINSPSGLLGLVKSAMGGKHEQSDDHAFNLDLSRSGTPGGGLGGMSTGLGQVGGPVQAMAKRNSTNAAMKALGGMARGTGGGLGAVMSNAGGQARTHMQWLDQSVKHIYKVDR